MTQTASSGVFGSLAANLRQAVSATEKRKADPNTGAKRPPRYAARAAAIRKTIVAWLTENGPATAAEVAAHFGYLHTTAHSYLNRIVRDGQATLSNRGRVRVFVVGQRFRNLERDMHNGNALK